MSVVLGSFDEIAIDEGGSRADERDHMRGVDHAPAALGGLDELERHRPREQLGQAVKSAYVKCRAPVLVMTRSISCAPQVPAKATTEVAEPDAAVGVHGLNPSLQPVLG